MSILKVAPEGAEVLDLVGARAARAEARKGTPAKLIKLTVGFVEVLPELNVLAAEKFAAGDIRGGLRLILADPADADALVEGGITAPDLETIVGFAAGSTPGE